MRRLQRPSTLPSALYLPNSTRHRTPPELVQTRGWGIFNEANLQLTLLPYEIEELGESLAYQLPLSKLCERHAIKLLLASLHRIKPTHPFQSGQAITDTVFRLSRNNFSRAENNRDTLLPVKDFFHCTTEFSPQQSFWVWKRSLKYSTSAFSRRKRRGKIIHRSHSWGSWLWKESNLIFFSLSLGV